MAYEWLRWVLVNLAVAECEAMSDATSVSRLIFQFTRTLHNGGRA